MTNNVTIKINYKKCDNCEACVMVCPTDALIYIDKLKYREKKCKKCGNCENYCPLSAISLEKI